MIPDTDSNDFSGATPPPPPPPPPAPRPKSTPEPDTVEITEVVEVVEEVVIEPTDQSASMFAPSPGQQQLPTPPPEAVAMPAPGYTPPAPPLPEPPQTAPAGYAQPTGPAQPGSPVPPQGSYPPPAMGAPAPQPIMAPAGPSPFGMTWSAIWNGPWKIWSGKSLEALEMGQAPQRVTGNSWMMWLMTFLLNSILCGLILATSGQQAASLANGYMYEYIPWASMGITYGFGEFVQLFFFGLLLSFAYLTLRVVALMFTNRIYGSQTTYSETANYFASAQTLLWLPLGILWLTALIGIPGLMPFVTLFIIGMTFMAEITTYVGILKSGPHRASPITAYTWFTVLVWIVTFFVSYVLLEIIF